MTAPLRIAIAGRFYWHNGSSHALLGYVRAAERLGHDLRASRLGIVDEVVARTVPLAAADWKPDLLVLVCEERFLTPEARKQVELACPRQRRVLIDPDGRYSPLVDTGTDANHPSAASRAEWAADFEELADVIVQPTLGAPAPGTKRFLYFGVDVHRERRAVVSKTHDVVYVGNNWHRWRDVAWLVEGLAPVRQRVPRIALFGQWWDGETVAGCEPETTSDPAFLATHGIETYPSVPFDGVEAAMGRGRLSPVLVRPILNALELATPRMFETFAADTVPVLMPYFRHAEALYGPEVAPLVLPDDPAGAVVRMLDEHAAHAALARDIAARLATEHSYEVRLAELLDIGLT